MESDDTKPSFLIGRLASDHLVVHVMRRCHPECQDYWDGNWVDAKIEVFAGGFRGAYRADLRTEEFSMFRDGLAPLYSSLSGEACFSSMEEWLTIQVKGDGLGHFTADCKAMDDAGIGNMLQFSLKFDQTDIPEMLSGLDAVLRKFPVRGNPND